MSARVNANQLKTRGIHVARHGQTREQQRPGAAPLVLHMCFIVDNNVQIVIVVQDFNFLNARTQVAAPCSHISFFLQMTVFFL